MTSLHYDFSIYFRNVYVNERLPDSTMKSHSAIRNSFKFGHQSALNPWTVCLLYRSLHYRAKPTLPIPPTARLEPLPRPNLPCTGVNNIPAPGLGARTDVTDMLIVLLTVFVMISVPRQVWELGARTCVYWSTWGGTRMTTRLLVF